jgi:hypothetical protein
MQRNAMHQEFNLIELNYRDKPTINGGEIWDEFGE